MKRALSAIFNFLFASINAPLIGLVGLMVLSSFATVSYLTKNPQVAGLVKGPEIIKREEDALITEVRKIIDLPSEERPTVATVTEPEKLAGQKFFSKAQEGDRILVFNEAGKAVLYRPSEKRVVELGNLNITGEQEEVAEVMEETDEEDPTATPRPTQTPEPEEELETTE